MTKGRFIVFEGGEGCGKSTQSRRLELLLQERGHRVALTREPGGSAGAEQIRELLVRGDADRWSPMVELLLFNAARADHLERTVRPALEAGHVVICDRYVGSTLAYQTVGGRLPPYAALSLHAIAADWLWPDLTIILDTDPKVGLARSLKRQQGGAGETRFEAKDVEFHARVRAAFRAQAGSVGRGRHTLIEADRPIAEVADDVLAAALAVVEPVHA